MRERAFVTITMARYEELVEKEKTYDLAVQAFTPCVMDAINKAFEELEQEEKENEK